MVEEEEEPSQGERPAESSEVLLFLPTIDQQPCHMVIEGKELLEDKKDHLAVADLQDKESDGPSLAVPFDNNKPCPMVIRDQGIEETVDLLESMFSEQSMTVVFDEEGKQGHKTLLSCPSDKEKNPMVVYAKENEGSRATLCNEPPQELINDREEQEPNIYKMVSVDTEGVISCCLLEQTCEKKVYPVGAALCNPFGWICFLNCILQCMAHTVPLVLKLRSADHPYPCPRAFNGFCCYCLLKLHVNESIRLSGNVLYPIKFVRCLHVISPDFERGMHQDAHEFLRCLLDKLDTASVVPMPSSKKHSSCKEDSIVKQIFGGRLKSQLHCPKCNHCSDTYEPFLDLSLEVVDMDTVVEALTSFTKVELVEDFTCYGCKSYVSMEKHLKVDQAPEVLVIQLKRFQNFGDKILKICDMVEYQLELDLNPFMSSPDNEPLTYDLYGVVEHMGLPSRGHYVCYIRSSPTDWYLFNDEEVRKFSEAYVLGNKAYLLFYAKQGSSPWFSTLLEGKKWLPLLRPTNSTKQDFVEASLFNDKEEVPTYPHEQDDADYCLRGTAEKKENAPSLLELPQRSLERNENSSTSLDLPDSTGRTSGSHGLLGQNDYEDDCTSGGLLGETEKLSSTPGSTGKSGHVGSLGESPEKTENISLQGSSDMKEMTCSRHGSEVGNTGNQRRSPQENGNRCNLLELSHKHEDGCNLHVLSKSNNGEVNSVYRLSDKNENTGKLLGPSLENVNIAQGSPMEVEARSTSKSDIANCSCTNSSLPNDEDALEQTKSRRYRSIRKAASMVIITLSSRFLRYSRRIRGIGVAKRKAKKRQRTARISPVI